MKNIVRKITTALGAVAMSASLASAQSGGIAATCGAVTIPDGDVCFSTLFSFTGAPGSFQDQVARVFISNGASYELLFDGISNNFASGVPFSYTSFGDVLASGTMSAGISLTGQQIFMQIVQTSPTGGNATVVGTLGGTFTGTASQATINWSSAGNATIGNVFYQVELNDAQRSTRIADTGVEQTIRGQITNNVVPEPSTYMLLATGMGALGLVARRRRTNV